MAEPLPPLASLRAFEAAARHMRFNRAAAELGVTPSAISHQVRALEDALALRLFRRAGRRPVLTEAGQRLAGALAGAFGGIAGAIEGLRAEAAGRPLTVSLRPYFALKWLSPRLGRFWARHPDVELRLHHTNNRANFAAQDIDLAIEWLTEESAGAGAVRLVRGDLTPVCSPRLVAGPPPLRRPGDLRHHTLLHEADDDRWAAWLARAGLEGLEARHDLVIDDTNVRTQAAIDGQGVELGCPALIEDDLAAGRLAAPFGLRLRLYAYYLVCPPRAPERRQLRAFRDWLLAEAAAPAPAPAPEAGQGGARGP